MELKKNTRVTFIESPHSYLLDGDKPLLGVTSLMKKHGLSADYGNISEEVLANAAALGSQAHQTIENYINGLPTVETPLVSTFKRLGLNIIATEYLVSDNETVASAVDLVEGVDEKRVVLWDMKRTSTVHRDALAWQLGIYKYLFEQANPGIEVVGCRCLPIRKGSTESIEADVCGTPVDINPVPGEEVLHLLSCERNGLVFTPETKGEVEATFTDETEVLAVSEAIARLAAAEKAVKEAESAIADFKDRAYTFMLEKDIDALNVGGVTIKLKRPYKSERLDSTRFKKENPELAAKYIKVSETKGSISLTVNQ